MTRERISKLSIKDLIKLAEIFSIDVDNGVPASNPSNGHLNNDVRWKLEEQIFETLEEVRLEQKQSDSLPIRSHQKHFMGIEEFFGQKLNDRTSIFTFPEQYNLTRIMLMLRDPEWAFTYWDISNDDRTTALQQTNFEHFSIVLKEVCEDSDNASLIEDPIEMDIPVQISDNNWYLNLPRRNSSYLVELVAHYRPLSEELSSADRSDTIIGEPWVKILASSGIIKVPPSASDRVQNYLSSNMEETHSFDPVSRKLT